MEDEGEDFRSWDEDDYISVGAQITLDMKRVGHCVPDLNIAQGLEDAPHGRREWSRREAEASNVEQREGRQQQDARDFILVWCEE